MDTRGYMHLQNKLKDAQIPADISPKPLGFYRDVSPFTVNYPPQLDRMTVQKALGAHEFEGGEVRITTLTPEVRLIDAAAGKMEFEDVLD